MNKDQYYTRPHIAKQCYDFLAETIDLSWFDQFIEPCAGEGSFLKLMPVNKRTSYDIEPKLDETKQQDFLELATIYNPQQASKTIVITNPPFGYQSLTALAFFIQSSTMADTIAFLVPMSWGSYNQQRRIPSDFKLLGRLELQAEAFYTPTGRDFSLACIFQIWSRWSRFGGLDMRQDKPASKHKDFTIEYDRTDNPKPHLWEDFDFALRTGDYGDKPIVPIFKEPAKKTCNYLVIKCSSEVVKNKLLSINFREIAYNNAGGIFNLKRDAIIRAYDRLNDLRATKPVSEHKDLNIKACDDLPALKDEYDGYLKANYRNPQQVFFKDRKDIKDERGRWWLFKAKNEVVKKA